MMVVVRWLAPLHVALVHFYYNKITYYANNLGSSCKNKGATTRLLTPHQHVLVEV